MNRNTHKLQQQNVKAIWNTIWMDLDGTTIWKMDTSCEPSNSPSGFVLKRNSLMGSQRSTCEEDVYFDIFL